MVRETIPGEVGSDACDAGWTDGSNGTKAVVATERAAGAYFWKESREVRVQLGSMQLGYQIRRDGRGGVPRLCVVIVGIVVRSTAQHCCAAWHC